MLSRFGIMSESIKKGVRIVNEKFQKLVLAIPLPAKVSAVFAIILGLIGGFMPPVFVYVTIRDAADILSNLIVSRVDLFTRIDLISTCYEYLDWNELTLPPYWISDSIWNSMFRLFPVVVGMSYFSRYGSKKSNNLSFALPMGFIVVLMALSIMLTPDRITCGPGWQVTITGYSISWFSFFLPIFSLLLGGYALLKEKTMRKAQSPS